MHPVYITVYQQRIIACPGKALRACGIAIAMSIAFCSLWVVLMELYTCFAFKQPVGLLSSRKVCFLGIGWLVAVLL